MAAGELRESSLSDLQWSIVGAALREPQKLGELAAMLRPEDFSEGLPAALWAGLLKLHFGGRPVDRVALRAELDDDPGWDSAIKLALNGPCGDAVYYAQLLLDRKRLEDIHSAGIGLSLARDLDEGEKLIDELARLGADRGRAEVTSSATAAQEFLDRLGSKVKPEYLKTGIEELDKRLFLELGDFVAIGGYPKAGKTLLGIQIARQLAEKYRVGYFFLESSKEKLMDRVISSMSRVPMTKIKNRDLREDEWLAISRAAEKFSSLKMDVINAAGMSVRDIQAISLNKRYQVVFVDYLQLVEAPGNDLRVQVTNVSKGLHVMGRKHGIAVIALAQLSRPEKLQGKPVPPNLSSFRESGQIEQDIDAGLLLYPSDPLDNSSHRILNLAKNKEGESCRVELDFRGDIQTFTPIKKSYGSDEMYKAGKAAKAARRQEAYRQTTFYDVADDEEVPF